MGKGASGALAPSARPALPTSPYCCEFSVAVLLLVLGLMPRLAFVLVFPTLPISDFLHLVGFALHLNQGGLTAPGWYWDYFNPGLPMALSPVLRVSALSPETTARLATATLCGLTPLLPFILWRRAVPLGVRALAGVLLAVWPGQISFTGVVAQDNWVLFPTIALACVAVRTLISGEGGRPVLAGLLYVAAVAIRQEMLLVLLPLVSPAMGLGLRRPGSQKRLAAGVLAVGIPLLALATQRCLATGRFALTSAHGGTSVLGAYVPGSTANYWIDPLPYIASVQPVLLQDPKRLREEAGELVLAEAMRRPGFHALRITSAVLKFSVDSETDSLYWSVLAPDGLPAHAQPLAYRFAARVGPLLKAELGILHALFTASLILGLLRRNRAILLLGLVVLLKVGLHAVTVAQGRYFLAAFALEILGVALGCYEAVQPHAGPRSVLALGVGTVMATCLALSAPRVVAYTQALDTDGQRTYRFLVTAPGGGALRCVVDRGRLTTVLDTQAAIEPLRAEPAPGESAVAACDLNHAGAPTALALGIFDGYAPGGLPGRMLQRVEIDGVEVFSHDLAAEPGSGWLEVPLGVVGPETRRRVRIEVSAVRPDSGVPWGRAANTAFRLMPAKEES